MPTAAAFVKLTDNKISVKLDGPAITIPFGLPQVLPMQPAVLMFVCFVNPGGDGLTFNVSINDTEQLRYGFSSPQVMTLHEVLDPGILKASGNSLRISVVNGDGKVLLGGAERTISFGDIVLWYHQSI